MHSGQFSTKKIQYSRLTLRECVPNHTLYLIHYSLH